MAVAKRKTTSKVVSPNPMVDQAAACAFRFFRQPNRPNPPRPAANKGNAAGNGKSKA
jgi:hypothetical protein